MRIFKGDWAEDKIENDERTSKLNHQSRRNCTINNAILEKWLMCDLSIRDSKLMIRNLLDLEACYNRQLPNIRCAAKEVLRVERESAKLFVQMLLVMNNHTCVSFRISEDSHGSLLFKLMFCYDS